MIHSTRIAVAMLIAAATCIPSIGRAWSSPGHKAVCQIAFLELEKKAPDVKNKVVEILSAEPAASGFRSFPVSCTWADIDKHTAGTIQNKRQDDHFINIERDKNTISGPS